MTAQSYVIEIADEAAGIVVQERGGFRFYASSSACASLNQQMFSSARGAEQACRDLMEVRTIQANRLERFASRRVTALASSILKSKPYNFKSVA